MDTHNHFQVIIIGSGPAGLAAAYSAAIAGCRVLVIEKMASPGMKLLASGGGRCNVSNTLELEDFAARFGKNWRFLLPALENFHGEKLLEFFSAHQLPLVAADGFHYFPASGRAGDVLKLFTAEITRLGGRIICSREAVFSDPGNDFRQITAGNEKFSCSSLVLACGGRGYPLLGGSMAGYALAGQSGHRVTPLYPGMTGVICTGVFVAVEFGVGGKIFTSLSLIHFYGAMILGLIILAVMENWLARKQPA